MTTKRTRLRVEELGAREVPSATMPAPTGGTAQTTAASPLFTGSGSGTYMGGGLIADAGRSYVLHGTADLQGQGHFQIAGGLHTVGFIRGGHAGGKVVLNGPNGSLLLQLTGPTQDGPAGLPTQFTYTVLSGTGHYQNLQGTGTLQLTVVPDAHQGHGPQTGAFKITF